MQRTATTHRVLTELDHVRIDRLLSRVHARNGEALLSVLDDADIVEQRQVPGDIVTMYSRITVEDPTDGSRRKYTLCYPEDADPNDGFVSVLSPIGTALLGRRCGDEVELTTPSGQVQRLRIVELLFQPEASGDYTR